MFNSLTAATETVGTTLRPITGWLDAGAVMVVPSQPRRARPPEGAADQDQRPNQKLAYALAHVAAVEERRLRSVALTSYIHRQSLNNPIQYSINPTQFPLLAFESPEVSYIQRASVVDTFATY